MQTQIINPVTYVGITLAEKAEEKRKLRYFRNKIKGNHHFILKNVCEIAGVKLNYIYKKTRKRDIVHIRSIVMWCLREYTNITFQGIGEMLGGKNHATVLHAYRLLNDITEKTDKVYYNKFEEIHTELKELIIKLVTNYETKNNNS